MQGGQEPAIHDVMQEKTGNRGNPNKEGQNSSLVGSGSANAAEIHLRCTPLQGVLL